jgi:hypothetical protein
MRSKQEYVQEKDPTTGKTTVRKVGLNPVQRDGMEYEFTAFLEIDAEHNAFGSKDRTGTVDQKFFKISIDTGRDFMKWLESGVDASTPTKIIAESKQDVTPDAPIENIKEIKTKVTTLAKEKSATSEDIKATVKELLAKYHPSGNPNKIDDVEKLKELLNELNNINVEDK